MNFHLNFPFQIVCLNDFLLFWYHFVCVCVLQGHHMYTYLYSRLKWNLVEHPTIKAHFHAAHLDIIVQYHALILFSFFMHLISNWFQWKQKSLGPDDTKPLGCRLSYLKIVVKFKAYYFRMKMQQRTNMRSHFCWCCIQCESHLQ